MASLSTQVQQIALKVENSLPTIIVFCSIVVAVFVPLSISNSHTIHLPETKRVLSGDDGFSKTNETIKSLMTLNRTIAEMIRNKVKGPSGDDGSKGSNGDYGQKGDRGMKGIQGDRGYIGIQGLGGNVGPKGEKGVRGLRGNKGDGNGPKGAVGPKGEKGDKGVGPFISPGERRIELGRNNKGDIKVYKITCHGNICRDVSLQLRISRGDADLYAKEDRPPKIMDSNCNDCTCKSRGSEQFDSCSVTTQRSNTFYAAVYAHKKYHDAVLTVNGPNFMNAELDTRDSLIHDDGDV